MMARSQHVPHVDFPILLMYCYNLLQFERGNQNSPLRGGRAISTTKLVPVGTTSVAVLVPGGRNVVVGSNFAVTCQIGR